LDQIKKIDRTTFSIENLVLNVEHIQHLTLAVQGDLIISIISIKNNVPPPAPIRFPQITEWKIVEKPFSLSQEMSITDPKNQLFYKIKGVLFTWGHQMQFFDLNGNELLYIAQKVRFGMNKYHVHLGGKKWRNSLHI